MQEVIKHIESRIATYKDLIAHFDEAYRKTGNRDWFLSQGEFIHIINELKDVLDLIKKAQEIENVQGI